MLTTITQYLFPQETPVANEDGWYECFTGKIVYGDNVANVRNASFMLENGKIHWLDGTWEDGIWEDGVWENGEWVFGFWYYGSWLNGVWHGGYWFDGVWHGGEWEFGVRKKKRSNAK